MLSTCTPYIGRLQRCEAEKACCLSGTYLFTLESIVQLQHGRIHAAERGKCRRRRVSSSRDPAAAEDRVSYARKAVPASPRAAYALEVGPKYPAGPAGGRHKLVQLKESFAGDPIHACTC